MERPLVTAVTHSTDEARVTLTGVPDTPGVAGRVFTALAEANVQRRHDHPERARDRGRAGRHVVHRAEGRRAERRRRPRAARRASTAMGIQTDPDMGKVSLVGAGMKSHPGVAAKTFSVLGEAGVNIEMISTSPIKISCVVRGSGRPRGGPPAARRVRARRGRDPPRGRHGRPSTGGELTMRVAVVGATGAVGSTILGVMRERSFPADEIVPFASERSAGRTIDYGDRT